MGAPSERGAVGRRIKERREALGMSQRELGDNAGVTGNAVHLVESGKTELPQPQTLGLYAQALKVSVHWLLTGSEPAPDGAGEWPALDIYLAETRGLTLDQSGAVERIVSAMEAERELAELRARRIAERPAAFSDIDMAREARRDEEDYPEP